MARTESNEFNVGKKAPDFNLINTVDDKQYVLNDLKGEKGTLIMFICNHCPFVIHVNEELVKMANQYQNKGIQFIAISSNDVVNYPQDGPEKMRLLWEELGLEFPYLYDETQDIAKKYKAECTPEFYLFNEDRKLVYRGRLDETSPGSGKDPDGKDLRDAMYCLIEGEKISSEQYPSMGCNIKWK